MKRSRTMSNFLSVLMFFVFGGGFGFLITFFFDDWGGWIAAPITGVFAAGFGLGFFAHKQDWKRIATVFVAIILAGCLGYSIFLNFIFMFAGLAIVFLIYSGAFFGNITGQLIWHDAILKSTPRIKSFSHIQCPKCLTVNLRTDEYCFNCSKLLVVDELKIHERKKETVVCPVCGADNQPGFNTCSGCNLSYASINVILERKKTIEEKPIEKETLVCPSCNSELSKEASFCTGCGLATELYDQMKFRSDLHFCFDCGRKLDHEGEICSNCAEKYAT